MGLITRKRAGIAGGAIVTLAILTKLTAPLILGAAVDRGLRDLARHQDLIGKRGTIGHAGLGFSLKDLTITTRDDIVLLTIDRAAINPVFAWPPADLSIHGATLTDEGLTHYTRTFEATGRSWYRNAKSGVARQNRNLHGATPTVHLRDVTITRPTGTIHIADGIATWSAPSPSRAAATFRGTVTLNAVTASVPVSEPVSVTESVPVSVTESVPVPVPVPVSEPEPGPAPGSLTAPATATLHAHVTQDAVTLRLDLDLSGNISSSSRRSPAPGWQSITSNDSRWTGPNPLAKHLLGW